MSRWTVILRSLLHHWRINLSVALGVAAATAVLTGALLVGDSMRGSLKDLVLERLGLIDQVLIGERFFRAEMAEEVAAAEGFDDQFTAALPVILLQTTLENPASDRRAAAVTTIGGDENTWQLDPSREYPELKYGELVLNQPLADELGVKVDEEVLLRLARPSNIPADSPLGRKIKETQSRRLKVAHIIPPSGLGRFSLHSNQQIPLVAFTHSRTLQGRSLLNRRNQVNAVIVAGKQRDVAADGSTTSQLEKSLSPTLADYGLTLDEIRIGDRDDPLSHYFQLTSDQMVIPPAVVDAVQQEFADDKVQPAITYLANWVAARGEDGEEFSAKIPYSTVTAVDSTAAIGPLLDEDGRSIPLADDQIILNSWATDDLNRQGASLVPGDEIRLTFFEPESTHGDVQEQTATFHLAKTVPLAAKGEPPTRVTDPNFTPTVPGLTDQDSIDNWDPPFPYYRERVRINNSDPDDPYDDIDEQYWKAHKATPKAFVTYAAGEKLWTSRFGAVTTLRIPASSSGRDRGEGLTKDKVEARILQAINPADLGFVFRPVKQQALDAAKGTTSFSGLFIGFSFFIIAAAVMLVALLFQLGVQQRASQLGLELAVGLRRKTAGWMLVAEGLMVAIDGGLLGVALGVGYAWLMLKGLSTWWVDAVAARFLTLHVNWVSLVIGLVSGVLISVLAIVLAVRRTRRLEIRTLMSGRTEEAFTPHAARPSKLAKIVAVVCFVIAVGLSAYATQLAGEAQAGAFFGGGALLLTAMLLFVWASLKGTHGGSEFTRGQWPLFRLSWRNAGRNPGRSTLTIGLVAAATFLIVAISAFRIDPDEKGAGGFDVVAETTQPIVYDLNHAKGRKELLIDGKREEALSKADYIALKIKGGDDASCLNLYQPQQPRFLGVSRSMVDYFESTPGADFAWAETAAETEAEQANPWLLLDRTFDDTPNAVPVILDKNTAMYSLHLFVTKGTGVVWEVDVPGGPSVKLRIVGLLANSIFQGSLLIGEQQFNEKFPDVSGYRLLLAKSRGPTTGTLIDEMEAALGEWGLDAASCDARLDSLLAVQNTYLSTFQSLGALGLLLGTFGLATVQLRSVLERRGELALMRSAGFRRTRLAGMVLLEHTALLLCGLTVGLLAALFAVLPHWINGGAAAPLDDLAIYLGIILLVGLVSGLAAVAATLRAPLLSALRGA